MCTDVLILAGGSGDRLWPVSSAQKPKQFMTLADGESFLQAAIRRAVALDPEGDICIVTRRDWTDLVIADVRSLAARMGSGGLMERVLVMSEPCGKNTAPAIVWTAKYLLAQTRKNPASILLMASDHIINPLDSFVNDVRTASWFADRNNLVSFAIPPTAPVTGYGYIKAVEALPCPLDKSSPALRIDSFREKPDAHTARSYLEDGHYYWNSGIYAFRADFYLAEIAKHCPALTEAFSALASEVKIETHDGLRVMVAHQGLDEAYRLSPSISIDYALSEKCERSVTVRATFLWDDVGTWDSLAKYFDDVPGNTAPVDSKNCFVYSDIPVALCGVDDLVVVIKNGKALIAKKGETNLVKEALAIMKDKGYV